MIQGDSSGWAVVDVETTGLHPVRDRVIELAVIRLGEDAELVDEWSTLVDPERGSLRSGIHGLRARDLAGAPRFPDIIGDLLGRLAGRVIVAHNAPFDVGFLQAETIRAGIAWGPVEGLCTMEVVVRLGIAKSRKLHLTCAELGVSAGREHVALDDARAVAGLMKYLGPRLWSLTRPAAAPFWPLPKEPARVRQRVAVAVTAVDPTAEHLARRVGVPPGLGITDAAGSTYLGLLDHIVEDGLVTDNETEALSLFARACGITRQTARQLHLAYLDEMSRLAHEDEVITQEEQDHLAKLTVLLSRALPH